MDVNEIIEYVMHTPENTNPAILAQMIEDGGSGSGATLKLLVKSIQLDEKTTADLMFEGITDAAQWNGCSIGMRCIDAGRQGYTFYITKFNSFVYDTGYELQQITVSGNLYDETAHKDVNISTDVIDTTHTYSLSANA